MKDTKATNLPHWLPNLLLILAIAALGLLCASLFQAQLDPMLQKGYGFFAVSTTGLLALHHSLLH